MAGTYTQNSAEGQLAAAKATLYTVPASTTVLVKTISLTNSDAANAKTVNIYFKRGTSRRVTARDYSLAAGATVLLEFNHILLAADLIEGDASSATTVDYWISLIEET